MGRIVTAWKAAWEIMLEPGKLLGPRRETPIPEDTDPDAPKSQYTAGFRLSIQWTIWGMGWLWAVTGLVAGALIAPSIIQFAGLTGNLYTDWLVIAVAVFTGFLVQLLGWTLFFSILRGGIRLGEDNDTLWGVLLGCLAFAIFPLSIAGIGYGIYSYLTWVGADRRTVTIAFVGGLLVKTFLIPLIKGIVTGALFRWFVCWLRGDKAKSA